jgi:predicted amidophosphoribosyltransferase
MPDLICPHCKNPIYEEDALLCHFCGNSLNRSSSGFMGKMRGAGMKWVWLTLVALALLAFILTMWH